MEVRELGLIGAFGVAFVLGMLVWIWWRRKTVYRRELPRIYELRDLLPNPPPPGAYFCNLDKSLAEIPQSCANLATSKGTCRASMRLPGIS